MIRKISETTKRPAATSMADPTPCPRKSQPNTIKAASAGRYPDEPLSTSRGTYEGKGHHDETTQQRQCERPGQHQEAPQRQQKISVDEEADRRDVEQHCTLRCQGVKRKRSEADNRDNDNERENSGIALPAPTPQIVSRTGSDKKCDVAQRVQGLRPE